MLAVYLDDILIASTTEEEHRAVIRTVCKGLQDFELAVRLEKYLFGLKSIEFLGDQVLEHDTVRHPRVPKTF